jgi:hypothetical protein
LTPLRHGRSCDPGRPRRVRGRAVSGTR